MLDKKFGDSGNTVVIEEFLTGPENVCYILQASSSVYTLLGEKVPIPPVLRPSSLS